MTGATALEIRPSDCARRSGQVPAGIAQRERPQFVARGLAELLQGIEAGAKLRRVVDRAWSRWTGNANISIAFSHRHAPNKLHASTPGIC